MRVGYVGNLCKVKFTVEDIVQSCVENDVNILILCGNISRDYVTSLDIINRLGYSLSHKGISLRFIVGNKDLYYRDEVVVDKERKIKKILDSFYLNEYCLRNRPILRRGIRIIDGSSHYDYSYYRGKPVSLKVITRKRKMWYRNKDNDYITSKDDYALGLENAFDMRYTKELNKSLGVRLSAEEKKYGNDSTVVVCTNIIPHRSFLSNGVLSGYKGTYLGNVGFHDILKEHGVKECYFGEGTKKMYYSIGGYINYYCCSVDKIDGIMEVVDYE